MSKKRPIGPKFTRAYPEFRTFKQKKEYLSKTIIFKDVINALFSRVVYGNSSNAVLADHEQVFVNRDKTFQIFVPECYLCLTARASVLDKGRNVVTHPD